MNSDFSEYKFVVSSGCSYGRLSDYTFNPFRYFVNEQQLYSEYNKNWLDTNNQKVISINTSLGSMGSDWQSDSLIYIVDKLLDLGVKSENIYCLVEWSQWHRFSIHPFSHYGLDLNSFDFQKNKSYNPYFICEIFDPQKKYDEIKNHDKDFIYNHFNISNSKIIPNIGKIEDRIYLCPQHTNIKPYIDLGLDYKLFYEFSVDLELRIPPEVKIKTYLDNILRTQYYLKKHDLKYNFLFMQSTLSDWHKKNNIIYHPLYNLGQQTYEIINNCVIKNNNYNPLNDIQSDIEVVMPEIKNKVQSIDFQNFWFYENEKYRRGGIDEWSIDNLKECGYVNLTHKKVVESFTHGEILPKYGEHPNLLAYILLWNKVTFNCEFVKIKNDFIEFISKKYWEDYHSDKFSENNLTISLKEWKKICKLN